LRLEAAWAVALPLAYLLLLPYGHRFGRYLVPALPAYAILACAGIRSMAAWYCTRWPGRVRIALPGAGILLGLAAAVMQLRAAAAAAQDYTTLCQYHHARHERTGHWLAANTPPDAVIATHDVGAIGYYSRRKIVDIAGVIDPQVARHLWQPGYIPFLEQTFAARHVTHVVTLREWMAVDNVPSMFTADPQPDWMDVYPWRPGHTHLLDPTVNTLVRTAESALRAGDVPRARRLAERALQHDQESARLWSLAGRIHEKQADYPAAEAAYRRALALFPEADDTRYRLAVVLVQQRRLDAARAELRTVVGRKPGHAASLDLLRQLGN
jgi:tetratricopeptide (TPR) repeat protein